MKRYKKIICFDLDNVICFTNKKKVYKESKPNFQAIKLINHLFKNNFKIIIFTARGMSRFKRNIKKIKKNYLVMTKRQLEIWGVNYHELIFGKPSFDIYIDDKNLGFKKNNWNKELRVLLKIYDKKNL